VSSVNVSLVGRKEDEWSILACLVLEVENEARRPRPNALLVALIHWSRKGAIVDYLLLDCLES